MNHENTGQLAAHFFAPAVGMETEPMHNVLDLPVPVPAVETEGQDAVILDFPSMLANYVGDHRQAFSRKALFPDDNSAQTAREAVENQAKATQSSVSMVSREQAITENNLYILSRRRIARLIFRDGIAADFTKSFNDRLSEFFETSEEQAAPHSTARTSQAVTGKSETKWQNMPQDEIDTHFSPQFTKF